MPNNTAPSCSYAVAPEGVADARPVRIWALLPCAGTGQRAVSAGMTMKAGLPKQYQDIAGQPLVLHTLGAFAAVAQLAGTLVAVAPGDTFLQAHRPADAPWQVQPCGGPSRAATVKAGLQALLRQGAEPSDWVLVHDAARCLITPAAVQRLIDAVLGSVQTVAEVPAIATVADRPASKGECANPWQKGWSTAWLHGALLASPVPDTLKKAAVPKDGSAPQVTATVAREGMWLAQTPQMFRIAALLHALHQHPQATDEASAIEAIGGQPLLVPAGAWNLKVTYPDDFALAQAIVCARQASQSERVDAIGHPGLGF